MSKDFSTKYYQKNKESLQKRSRRRYQDLSEEGKNERQNMLANNIKIFLEMKNKDWLIIERISKNMEK